MSETIKKSLGEGHGKGENYAALAHDTSDRFGGLEIKSICLNWATYDETTGDGRVCFYDRNMYIAPWTATSLDIVAPDDLWLFATDIYLVGDVHYFSEVHETTTTEFDILLTDPGPAGVNAIHAVIDAGALWTSGNMVAMRGNVDISGDNSIVSATGVWAGIDITGNFTRNGLVCGLNVEVQSNKAASPNALVYIQSLPKAGANFADVPYIAFTELEGGQGSNLLFSLGHQPAGSGRNVTADTSGDLLFEETIRIEANGNIRYIPLSTEEGTYTTNYPIVTTYSAIAIDISTCTTGIDITGAATGINLNGTMTTGITISACATANIAITGANATGISFTGSYSAHGMVFAGSYTEHIIDFTDVTGPLASGQKVICAGGYGAGAAIDIGPSGTMLRMCGQEDGDAGTAAITFFYGLNTGDGGFIGDDALIECSAASPGPKNLKAGQFTVALLSNGYLADTGGLQTGMFAISASVQAENDSVASSGCRVAPIWLSNQMSCTVSGEEYAIYAITGASRPDAFIGFYTSSSGYDQFIYCGTTFNSGAGTCFITQTDGLSTQSARIKVWYDGKQYYLALYE